MAKLVRGVAFYEIARWWCLYFFALDNLATSTVTDILCSEERVDGCKLIVEVVSDSNAAASTWRTKLGEELTNLHFVGPNNYAGTWHAGYEGFSAEMVVHGCPGYAWLLYRWKWPSVLRF